MAPKSKTRKSKTRKSKTRKSKTRKSKSKKTCNDFCNKYYVPKMNKLAKKAKKHFKSMGMKESKKLNTKKEYPKHMERCKKVYCNPKCDGIWEGFANTPKKQKKLSKEYKKLVKDGVYRKVSKEKAEELKKKGATSVCKKPIENINDMCTIS